MYAIAHDGSISSGGPVPLDTVTDTGPNRCDVSETLEHRPEAVAAARRITRDALGAWRVDSGTAEGVVLVVSELVTNSVEHAEPPLELHLRREGADAVKVAVSDGGASEADGEWTASCEEDEHGRGLIIVDSLADAHGEDHHDNGTTTHWAYLTAH
ncbi:ATP-binding protein [Streptomyces sp. NPDC055607]